MNIEHAIRRLATPMLLSAVAALTIGACSPPDAAAPAADEMVETTPAVEMATAEPVAEEPMATEAPLVAAAVTIAVSTSDTHGDYLVDGNGMSLYLFLSDTPESSACTGGCAENWPPVVVDDLAATAEGVDAMLLGKLTRDDGSMQVTYNSHPLYWYAADAAAGDVNGHGVGDAWYLVTPAGEQVPAGG